MSLERFRRPRMIVLHPHSTVYEAARAMADNHVGAVLVAEQQCVVGIVTDRDLALEVIAGELDAKRTTVHDVMSEEVATVDVGASVEDVVRILRERSCRRLPVMEHDKPVGMVSLDDLLASGAIGVDDARAIVTAQLEVAARLKPEGTIHPEPQQRGPELRRLRAMTRRKARAENAFGRLLRAVSRHSGLEVRDRAELALGIVLGALCRRVTPEEARHLIAQLPSKLHPDLEAQLRGPDRGVTIEAIEAELVRQLHLAPDAANLVLLSVCEAIADSVSAGEIEAFRGQLPLDMKDLFPPTPIRRAV